MLKNTIISTIFFLLYLSGLTIAQVPTGITEPVKIASGVTLSTFRGHQTPIFCEPTTGNIVVGWFKKDGSVYSIQAAISTDGGSTFTEHIDINGGVGDPHDGRYLTVWGTSQTPLIAYSDRSVDNDSTRFERPTVAFNPEGWGASDWFNIFVNDRGTLDTALADGYICFATAPDDENLWGFASINDEDPIKSNYAYYRSEDAGETWSYPVAVMSDFPDDSLKGNYQGELSSTGMGIGFGTNGAVMACGVTEKIASSPDQLRLTYAISSDKGETWSDPMMVPGSENIYFERNISRNIFTKPIMDKAGNWHIFGVARDTTMEGWDDFPRPFLAYDFKYDGSVWSINQFVQPQLLTNGIAALADYPTDDEDCPINQAAIGPDGTIYYLYTDVTDTTGAMGDETKFNYNMMVMASQDNGDTWHGPFSILENWEGFDPSGLSPYANDKIHVCFRQPTPDDDLYYMGVPTDSITSKIVGVESLGSVIPENFRLYQNYPNPFNPSTTIEFDLAKKSHVTLSIYNAIGELVAKVVDKELSAGKKGVVWNANKLASGIYMYKLETQNFSQTKKLMLVK